MGGMQILAGPPADPSFARRRTNATGPKIRQRPQLTNRAIWAGMDGLERVLVLLATVEIVVTLTLTVWALTVVANRADGPSPMRDYISERVR